MSHAKKNRNRHEHVINKLPISIGSDGFDKQNSYVMKNYITENSLCCIYGPSGSYKSFLAISWACHIATGIEWSGNRVNPGVVIYIVGEGGIGVSRRVKAWENIYNKKVSNLILVNRPVFPADPSERRDLLSGIKYIEGKCRLPVRLIIFDTLARCYGNLDENNSQDMGRLIVGCDAIKNGTSASVLLVHHSGKDETKGARGSSSLKAALDVEFNVKKDKENQSLILSCTKMKDAEEPKCHAYKLHESELFIDSDGERISSLAVIDHARKAINLYPELSHVSNLTDNHKTVWEMIHKIFSDAGRCTKKMLRDELKQQGIEIKHFHRWVKKFIDDGMLLEHGEELLLVRQ